MTAFPSINFSINCFMKRHVWHFIDFFIPQTNYSYIGNEHATSLAPPPYAGHWSAYTPLWDGIHPSYFIYYRAANMFALLTRRWLGRVDQSCFHEFSFRLGSGHTFHALLQWLNCLSNIGTSGAHAHRF